MLMTSCVASARFLKTSLKKIRLPSTSYCVLKINLSNSSKESKLKSDNAEPAHDCENYDLAYTFPYIQIAAVVNKLKLYQTFVSGIAIPLSYTLQAAGVIPLDAALPIAALSLASLAALYSAGWACSDLVGRVWVSRPAAAAPTQVRLSSVGFWGRRAELSLPAADLVPLADLPERPAALYVTLRRYSQPAALKLCLRYGRVADAPAFRKAFGHGSIH